MNQFVRDSYKARMNAYDAVFVETVTRRFSNIIPDITPELAMALYFEAESCRNSRISTGGKLFEGAVGDLLEVGSKMYGFSYASQIPVDVSTGFFLHPGYKWPGAPIVDFVIFPDGVNRNADDIADTHISDVIVVSCKTTCRERYKQDDPVTALQPLKYVLAVGSNEYPTAFVETTRKAMIVLDVKARDACRRHTFDDFFSVCGFTLTDDLSDDLSDRSSMVVINTDSSDAFRVSAMRRTDVEIGPMNEASVVAVTYDPDDIQWLHSSADVIIVDCPSDIKTCRLDGYFRRKIVLNSSDYGVPQDISRKFVIYSRKHCIEFRDVLNERRCKSSIYDFVGHCITEPVDVRHSTVYRTLLGTHQLSDDEICKLQGIEPDQLDYVNDPLSMTPAILSDVVLECVMRSLNKSQ